MSRDFVEMERGYLFGQLCFFFLRTLVADEADYRLYLRKDIPSFVR